MNVLVTKRKDYWVVMEDHGVYKKDIEYFKTEAEAIQFSVQHTNNTEGDNNG